MRAPILLVPGTQATELVAEDGSVAYNAVRASLGLDRDGEAIEAFARGALVPGRVLRTPYARLFEEFEVRAWGYDWRDELRVNARRMGWWIASQVAATGQRAVVVGHSQGGLLLALAAGPALARYVRAVVLVGAPFAGTLHALEAIAAGRGEFGEEARLTVRSFVRRWPSVAQMLPAWADWTVDPEGAAAWLEGALPPQVAAVARAARAALADPLAGFGDDIEVHCIFSDGHPTPAALTAPMTVGMPLAFAFEPGDGLVPLARTLAHGGARLADRSVILQGPTRPHAMLCDDDDVVALVREVVG